MTNMCLLAWLIKCSYKLKSKSPISFLKARVYIIRIIIFHTLLSSTSKVSKSPLVSPFKSVSNELSYSTANRKYDQVGIIGSLSPVPLSHGRPPEVEECSHLWHHQTVDAPVINVSGHPREAEKVPATEAGRFNTGMCKYRVCTS